MTKKINTYTLSFTRSTMRYVVANTDNSIRAEFTTGLAAVIFVNGVNGIIGQIITD